MPSIKFEALTADYLRLMKSDSTSQDDKLKFVETLFGLRNGYFFVKFIKQLEERGIKFAIITSENTEFTESQ
jgi:hypothetical protein